MIPYDPSSLPNLSGVDEKRLLKIEETMREKDPQRTEWKINHKTKKDAIYYAKIRSLLSLIDGHPEDAFTVNPNRDKWETWHVECHLNCYTAASAQELVEWARQEQRPDPRIVEIGEKQKQTDNLTTALLEMIEDESQYEAEETE